MEFCADFCGPLGFGPVQANNGLLTPCFVTTILYFPLYVWILVFGIWETTIVLKQNQWHDPYYIRNLWTIITSGLLILLSLIQFIIYVSMSPCWYSYLIVGDCLKIAAWTVHLVTQVSEMSRFLPSSRTVNMFEILVFIPATIEAYARGQRMYGSWEISDHTLFFINYSLLAATTFRGYFSSFFDFGRRILRPQDLEYNSITTPGGPGEPTSDRINIKRFFENWAGNIEMFPLRLFEPKTVDEIVYIVNTAGAKGKTVKVIGSAHSDTKIISTNGYLLSLQKMSNVLSIKPLSVNEYAVTVQAGINLKVLYTYLLEQHEPALCLPILGDISEQSIAGATGTGTHGSGSTFSSTSQYIIGMKFVDGKGRKIELTEKDEDLKAARVSFGCLGIVYEITLKCCESYNLHQIKRAGNVYDVLDNLKTYLSGNEHFEFYWFPHTESCQLIERSRTEHTDKPNIFKRFSTWYANNFIMLYVHRIANRWPFLTIQANKFVTYFLNEGPIEQPTDKVQSGAIHIERFTEMEIAVPFESESDDSKGIEAVYDIINLTKEALNWQKRYYSNQVVSIRFSRADTCYMSPLYLPVIPRKSKKDSWKPDFVWLSFNAYDELEKFKPFFEDARDLLLTKYNGRPHWGKECYLTAYDRLRCFPEADKFSQIRSKYDPQGVFLNTFLEDAFRKEHGLLQFTPRQ